MRTLNLSHQEIELLIAALKIATSEFSKAHEKSVKLNAMLPSPQDARKYVEPLWWQSCQFDDMKIRLENGDVDI